MQQNASNQSDKRTLSAAAANVSASMDDEAFLAQWLERARNETETFRLPSTALFLGLMPVFSGQARRADLTAALIDDVELRSTHSGKVRKAEVHTYIVHNSRECEARTSVGLFHDDPLWQEGELSGLIKRQFGPTGLKHLLGILIAAEDHALTHQPIPGGFIFDLNKHLDILGYKRSNRINGKAYHTSKHQTEAREIVGLLCSLTIVQEIRLGANKGTTIKVRLLFDETTQTDWEEVVTDGSTLKERITLNERQFLRINPALYRLAAEGTALQRYLYTHQLKKLAGENARNRSLCLTLGVHLPIKFRLSGGTPLRYTARAFLRMAGIAEDEYTAYEQLERVEKNLMYMVDQGYLGSFETERFKYAQPELEAGDGRTRPARARMIMKPRKSSFEVDPLDEDWVVEAPAFLRTILKELAVAPGEDKVLSEESKAIDSRYEQPNLPGVDLSGTAPHEGQLLRIVRRKLGMSQGALAKALEITQAAISLAESGKRPQMAERLFQRARRLIPEQTQQVSEHAEDPDIETSVQEPRS